MLVFIKNEPRTYAWGSLDAIPSILQTEPTGEPQAELWLGDHAGAPARLAKSGTEMITLIDLIKQAPDVYGVDGGPLPFLLKILGIGAPLSLQVHPNLEQAKKGFERENLMGLAIEDETRSYKDQNHKPELLVALSEVVALAGFRPVTEVLEDLNVLVQAAGTCGATGAQALMALYINFLNDSRDDHEQARARYLDFVFESDAAAAALKALQRIFASSVVNLPSKTRSIVLKSLLQHYPDDPGVLVSLLLNIVELKKGEALFVEAGQMHAYLSGVGVEVMASSDNVLRAGLTPKHVDVAGLREILNLGESRELKFAPSREEPGLTTWQPAISDFSLQRVRVAPEEAAFEEHQAGFAAEVVVDATSPLVMLVTDGHVRVERIEKDSSEVTSVRSGQSLYISSGGQLEISGNGEAYLATVGALWAKKKH